MNTTLAPAFGSPSMARIGREAHPGTGGSPMTPASMPRTLWAAAGFSLVLLACFAAAALLDSRSLYGANAWLKPAKFALSFFVLHATLAVVVDRLSLPVREGRAMRATVAAMLAATVFELFYIGGRAGLGRASHFAISTPQEALGWTLMGIGALTLVVGIGIIGALVARDRDARLGPLLRAGIVVGFGISALLTLITAGWLSSRGGPLVGVPSAAAGAIPLLRWSTEVGDLRPAHFLALHAMQVLPLVGWWLERRGHATVRAVHWLAAGWVALTGAVFIQALLGLPLIRL
jgi:hypothetical protein